jgi:hypothetical protein
MIHIALKTNRWIAFLSAMLSATVIGQPQWRTPERGSAERAAIMDAMRSTLGEFDTNARELIFVVQELCVSNQRGWVSVDPQSKDGKTKLETTSATLKRVNNQWAVDALACAEAECAKGTDAVALRAQVNPRCT